MKAPRKMFSSWLSGEFLQFPRKYLVHNAEHLVELGVLNLYCRLYNRFTKQCTG